MSNLESVPPASPKVPASEGGLVSERETVTCHSATHTALYEQDDERCSICDEALDASSEQKDDESAVARGRGLFVWVRGDERRYEEPHLCASCATGIGVSALQRWEIEEDEG